MTMALENTALDSREGFLRILSEWGRGEREKERLIKNTLVLVRIERSHSNSFSVIWLSKPESRTPH